MDLQQFKRLRHRLRGIACVTAADVLADTVEGDLGQWFGQDEPHRKPARLRISYPLANLAIPSRAGGGRAARTDGAGAGGDAKDIHGRDVLSAYAPVAGPGWLVFVEMPIEEAK